MKEFKFDEFGLITSMRSLSDDGLEHGISISDFGRQVQHFRRGKLHRANGPCLIKKDSEEWRRDGILHRIGGYARRSGNRYEWWKDGVLHRTGGLPAVYVLDSDGNVIDAEYWIDGKEDWNIGVKA